MQRDIKNILLAIPPMKALSLAPPIGVGYLASILKKQGYNIEIIHADKLRWDTDDFVGYVLKVSPDIVGFSVITMSYPAVVYICRKLREQGFTAPFILGGPHPSALPELSLRQTGAVAAVLGEGEISLPDLISAIRAGRSLSNVNGIAWIDDAGCFHRNKPASFIKDLNTIPFPAWDLMPPHTYPPSPHHLFFRKFPVAPLITSRGCRWSCSFCASSALFGHEYRKRGVENIIEEIRYLYENFGVREIHIESDNFTADEDYVISFCEHLIDAGLPVIWSCTNGIRIDTVTERVAKWMAKAGCYQVGLGIDVIHEKQMRRTGKFWDVRFAEKAVSILKKYGIETRGFYILGFDTDSEDDVKRTISFAVSLKTDFAAFGLWTPLPGSLDFKKLKQGTDLHKFDWSDLVFFRARELPLIPAKRLQKLLWYAIFRFYLRPKIILKILSYIKLRQIPYIIRGLYYYITGRKQNDIFKLSKRNRFSSILRYIKK